MSNSTFNQRCYTALKRVPAGKITTYRDLARAIGSRAYRAVGQAMAKNPYAPKVPCHRVIRSDGHLGGYAYGLPAKIKLLAKEGISVKNNRVPDFESLLFRFNHGKNPAKKEAGKRKR